MKKAGASHTVYGEHMFSGGVFHPEVRATYRVSESRNLRPIFEEGHFGTKVQPRTYTVGHPPRVKPE